LRTALLAMLNRTQKKGCIFIDGLDEFDKDSDVRDVFNLVQNLSNVPGFKLCVSSRQEVAFEKAFSHLPKVRLQDLTFADIQLTAADKLEVELQEAEYDTWDRDSTRELARTVASHADGVFLWAIMAVKSLCIGIRNEDNLETLTKRLHKMPREMSLLYEQMWSRLHEDEDFYRDETMAYLSVSQYIPLSLLDFTLATDDNLRTRFLLMEQKPDAKTVEKLEVACKAMERKVRVRTAGLLEVVEDATQRGWISWHAHQTLETYKSSSELNPPICTCGLEDPKDLSRCCSRRPEFEQLQDAHDKKVSYVHRSAAEFVATSLRGRRTSEEHTRMQMRGYEKLLLAQYITYGLGCNCTTAKSPSRILSRSLSHLDEARTAAVFSKMVILGINFLSKWDDCMCSYGWSHEIFNRQWRLSAVDTSQRYPYEHSLDFPGLMASYGFMTFLQEHLKSGGRWCSYYAGYLLLCCARGITQHRIRRDESTYLKQAQTIHNLVASGADMLTPQLSGLDIGTARLVLVPRPPLAECWLFIMRLLLECGGDLVKRAKVARLLAGVLLKRQYDHETEIVWSVCNRSKLTDLLTPIDPDILEETPNFWVALKMSIARLRMFVLSCIVSAE